MHAGFDCCHFKLNTLSSTPCRNQHLLLHSSEGWKPPNLGNIHVKWQMAHSGLRLFVLLQWRSDFYEAKSAAAPQRSLFAQFYASCTVSSALNSVALSAPHLPTLPFLLSPVQFSTPPSPLLYSVRSSIFLEITCCLSLIPPIFHLLLIVSFIPALFALHACPA